MKKPKKKSQLDYMRGIRKPMPPPSRVIQPKKYDRKDKSWKDES